MSVRVTSVLALVLCLASVSWAQEKTKPLVFPAPVKMEVKAGVFQIDKNTPLFISHRDEHLRGVAELLSRELGRAVDAPDGRLPILSRVLIHTQRGKIFVDSTGNPAKGAAARLRGTGGYRLHIGPDTVYLVGDDEAGCYYGALTLLQLFRRTGDGKGELQAVMVTDHPYHEYRGIRSTLPRGKPRKGEITHEYYRNLLRLWGFCRLNHVWVGGCSWNTPMKRHPELGWTDELTIDQAKGIVAFAERQFLSMDGSIDSQFLYRHYRHLAELAEGETWEDMAKKSRRVGRVNPCPSNPETIKVMYEQMEDTMDVLTGTHFAVPMDEMYQEYHGSRWGVCPLCKGKDPVRLWADFTNKLIAKVLERSKVPILGGGMLMYEHQGWYKDIYKAIDLVEHRDKIIIYNWSEGAIRRGAMRIKGKRLQNATFSATPFFKKHGYKDVCHLFAGSNWRGRPEMREVKGKLDCYGGFVSYYHSMNYPVMKQRGAIARTIFTAQHLWSPDQPAMESPEDRKMQRYGEAIADGIVRGKSYVEAIELARKAYAAPEGTQLLTGGAMGRAFASKSPAVKLMGAARGDRTEGTMTIVLPVEEAEPDEAYLVLTINDWDQTGEGEIFVNGHAVRLATSRRSNGRDYTFPPIPLSPDWLKFGPEANVLKFTYKKTAGFIVKKAEIVVCDAPGK